MGAMPSKKGNLLIWLLNDSEEISNIFWLIHFVKIPSHSTQSGSRPSKNIIYEINKNCNHNKYFQVKVWFQNRRTKHKREETETDQQKALSGSGLESGQTILEHDESDEEDIDCE